MTNWIEIAEGTHLALGHRPKFKLISQLGATHVATLLCEREGASEICSAVRYVGMESFWFPMPNADPKNIEPESFVANARQLAGTHGRIFLHCSAGIHRTGMFSYAALRLLGYEPSGAREMLARLRPITRDEVTESRLDAVEEILEAQWM